MKSLDDESIEVVPNKNDVRVVRKLMSDLQICIRRGVRCGRNRVYKQRVNVLSYILSSVGFIINCMRHLVDGRCFQNGMNVILL